MPTQSCLADALKKHVTDANAQSTLQICHAAVLDALTESALQEPRLPDIEQAAESRVLARIARSLKEQITDRPAAMQVPRTVRNVPPPQNQPTPQPTKTA